MLHKCIACTVQCSYSVVPIKHTVLCTYSVVPDARTLYYRVYSLQLSWYLIILGWLIPNDLSYITAEPCDSLFIRVKHFFSNNLFIVYKKVQPLLCRTSSRSSYRGLLVELFCLPNNGKNVSSLFCYLRRLVFNQSSPVNPVSESRGGSLILIEDGGQTQDRNPQFVSVVSCPPVSPQLSSGQTQRQRFIAPPPALLRPGLSALEI